MASPRGVAPVVTAFALAAWCACGSQASSTSPGAEAGADVNAFGDSSASSSSGSSSGSGSSSSGGDAASGSGGGDGASTGSSSGGGDGAAGSDGATPALWQPTTAAPIHFHWMIGASTFTSADILPNQNGQVVYDIDGANATAADVAAIHAAGAIAVCYVDVGSLEPNRPDTASFPSSVIGPAVQGWPGENWLLVTAANQSTILPLMKARFVNWCQAKGFDAIEPDNLDAWTNISNVNETDNVAYDLAIGKLAHDAGMSVGLKNVMTDLTSAQYPAFLAQFDWALNEQCYENSECAAYTAAGSFIPAGKAVFDVEYSVAPDCTMANAAHMNAQQTDLNLVGATDSGYVYTPCIPDSQATW
ncbi:MAG TPA: endo alpha-1,4 polygalactosaminidase [Polyangiaceae bacterium]